MESMIAAPLGYSVLLPKGLVRPVVAFDLTVRRTPVPISVCGVHARYALLLPDETVFSPASGAMYANVTEFHKHEGFDEAEEEPTAAKAPDPKLRDIGISGRACAPLARDKGVTTLQQLAGYERDEIADVKGVSVDTMRQFDAALEAAGLEWGGGGSLDAEVSRAGKPKPVQRREEPDDEDFGEDLI